MDVLVMPGDRLLGSGGYAYWVSACSTVCDRSGHNNHMYLCLGDRKKISGFQECFSSAAGGLFTLDRTGVSNGLSSE